MTKQTDYSITTLPKGEPINIDDFMLSVQATSPITLESISGIPAAKWRGWINNFRQGKMSLDKMLEIARFLKASTNEIHVIFNP